MTASEHITLLQDEIVAERAPSRSSRYSDLLREGQAEGVFPGATAIIIQAGTVVFSGAVGQRSVMNAPRGHPIEPSLATLDTIYDLGGLTSLMVTTTILMRLVELGKVDLHHRVSRYIPGFNVSGKSPITVWHLLHHVGGFPATWPYYEELTRAHSGARAGILTTRGARDFVLNQIVRSNLRYEIGTRQVWSEVGMLLLGFIIEEVTGLPLEEAASKYVFKPLALRSSGFIDLTLLKRGVIAPSGDHIAPTEECSWRKRTLCGEAHDENTWAMGGISGHAGVFSCVSDVATFGEAMRLSMQGTGSGFISRRVIDTFLMNTPDAPAPLGQYRLGWDTPGKENGLGDVTQGRKFGYSSRTGCSLWIDLESQTLSVLLSNSVHPSRNNRKINAFRAAWHGNV